MTAKSVRDHILACLIAGVLAQPVQAAPVQAPHVEAELIAEPAAVEAGKPFTAGLRLKMEPHWHVYWKNPGDAGLPVSLEWSLPPAYSAGPIQWPHPDRISLEPLVNYGYEGEILFPVEIIPSAKAQGGKQPPAGSRVEIKAKAKWVVCKEICLPGGADLSLSLPIAATGALPPPDPSRTEMFRLARARLPLPASPWRFSAQATDSLLTLIAMAPKGFQGTHPGFVFFPEEQEVLENAALQSFYPIEGGFALDLVRIPPDPADGAGGPDSLIGVAVSSRGWDAPENRQAVEIRVPLAKGKPAPKALAAAVALGKPAAHAASGGGPEGTTGSAPAMGDAPAAAGAGAGRTGFAKLVFMLSFAFLGGLILNLMPCVLPVLSLKIFDFVKRSGESRFKVFLHGLVFTGGVLVSFWILAGLLLILRQGGQELGWGFQLQSPSFLMVLCALFFFFSLNLFGVFELGYLFTRIGAGQNSDGHMSSFIAGVTATVVATPCTAPFMGSAMGYAFSQPPVYALLVFTFLGLGMASPYLLLAGFPAMMRFLPKPGEWMEHLKQFMGFPLLGTAIWLAWVLGKQAGVDALIALLFVLLLAGLSAWILGKWTALHRTTPVRVIAGILALVIFLPAFVLVLMYVDQQRGFSASSPAGRNAAAGFGSLPGQAGGIPWEPFSPERLEALLAEGKPVFIDFTADWCLSCKVNEKVALSKPEVAGKFRELGLAALKADWTLRDAVIARALAKYGRNSIPLYVLYTGNGDEHIILPEIISPSMVLEALAKVELPATTMKR